MFSGWNAWARTRATHDLDIHVHAVLSDHTSSGFLALRYFHHELSNSDQSKGSDFIRKFKRWRTRTWTQCAIQDETGTGSHTSAHPDTNLVRNNVAIFHLHSFLKDFRRNVANSDKIVLIPPVPIAHFNFKVRYLRCILNLFSTQQRYDALGALEDTLSQWSQCDRQPH